MRTAKILVLDYGIGNLYSVRRAVEYCDCGVVDVSANPLDVDRADRLIIPGVGAFEDGMLGLGHRGLIDSIARFARSGKPVLGICLGMQLLATQSDEFGQHDGLNLIPGKAIAIPRQSVAGEPIKVPFIGWTQIALTPGITSTGCLAKHRSEASVYMVHSYHVLPADPNHLLATYDYGGHRITAAIKRDNITGCQFHPEKSGEVGLAILKAFLTSD